MRKVFVALLSALIMLAAVLPALADPVVRKNPETGYAAVIDDAANLLDAAEYEGVLAEMMNITEYCNVGLYTCRDGSRRDPLEKAKDWSEAQKGKAVFGSEECTVFIIDMTNRFLAIGSSEEGGILDTLNTDTANIITDYTDDYARNGDYGRCAVETFRQIYAALDGKRIDGPMRYISCALIAVAAALLLAYLVISARMEQEVKVSLPEVATLTAGVGAAIVGKKLMKVVHHESSGGRGFGGGGGIGGGGGGGGGGFGGGGHGF